MAKRDKSAKPKKMTKAEREHIDNRIVMATAIGLVAAILLLYLNNWIKAYPNGTNIAISILMWICDVGVLVCLVLMLWKKERKFLFVLPYFAAGALLFSIIRYPQAYQSALDFLYISKLWEKFGALVNMKYYGVRTISFGFVYVCVAAYLIATYIYYAVKIKKGK